MRPAAGGACRSVRAVLLLTAVAACAPKVNYAPVSVDPSAPIREGVSRTPGVDVTVVVGAGASAKRRLDGQCFVECPRGTRCNLKTGFCDELPCHGECAADQLCDGRGLVPVCISSGDSLLHIRTHVVAPPGDAPLAPLVPTEGSHLGR